MRKYPKPLRDCNTGNAGRFTRVTQPRRENSNPNHHVSQVDFGPRINKRMKGVCNCYITNFPKSWKSKDLMEVLQNMAS